MDSMYPPRKDHPRAQGTIARSVVGRLLVLTVLAAGCSTVKLYDGAELSAQRAAFVMLGGKWSITHATGNQRMWVDGHGIEPPLYRAAVAPGCHRIDYQLCPRCYAVGRQRERGYVLAAGRSYEMRCNHLTTCPKPTAPNTLAFDLNYDALNRYCCSFVDADSGVAPQMCGR